MNASPPSPQRSLASVLLFAGLIVTVAMGIRHTFGLFLTPMSMDHQWSREVFSFALALQNLMWGATQPFAGFLADRFGARRVLWGASLLYTLGLVGMAYASTGSGLAASAGLLIGAAQSGCTYSVVFAALGALVPAAKRGWAMGVVAAAGSFGQFLMVPVENWLIGDFGWQSALFILGCLALAIVPLAWGLKEPERTAHSTSQQSLGAALHEAFGYPSFRWLMAGYFVCGFQVVFIGVHMPSYLKDHGLTPNVATTALALIGLFNVIGTYGAGALGQRLPKKYILSSIYLLRSIAIVIFLSAPLTPWSVYIFSSVMGVLWLSTVPPTNAVIAQIFGVQYLSMLGGFVFLSHQIGSFLGVWLGGKLYDATGNYDLVWWIAVALGIFAALANLPVRERAIERAPTPKAAVA